MSIINWVEKKTKRFTVWDFSFMKLGLIAFGIIIGAYISEFVRQYLWYFVAVFIICYLMILYRMFSK